MTSVYRFCSVFSYSIVQYRTWNDARDITGRIQSWFDRISIFIAEGSANPFTNSHILIRSSKFEIWNVRSLLLRSTASSSLGQRDGGWGTDRSFPGRQQRTSAFALQRIQRLIRAQIQLDRRPEPLQHRMDSWIHPIDTSQGDCSYKHVTYHSDRRFTLILMTYDICAYLQLFH